MLAILQQNGSKGHDLHFYLFIYFYSNQDQVIRKQWLQMSEPRDPHQYEPVDVLDVHYEMPWCVFLSHSSDLTAANEDM